LKISIEKSHHANVNPEVAPDYDTDADSEAD
jgi:hypothetical protein